LREVSKNIKRAKLMRGFFKKKRRINCFLCCKKAFSSSLDSDYLVNDMIQINTQWSSSGYIMQIVNGTFFFIKLKNIYWFNFNWTILDETF
jgi:hypothetical protein